MITMVEDKYQTVSLQKPRDPGPETTYDYADNTGKDMAVPNKGLAYEIRKNQSFRK